MLINPENPTTAEVSKNEPYVEMHEALDDLAELETLTKKWADQYTRLSEIAENTPTKEAAKRVRIITQSIDHISSRIAATLA